MIGIYKITSPSGKVYIGQSINIEKRLQDYSKLRCKNQVKLYKSLLKYGYENHKFEVIEECEERLLNRRERFWQEHYNVVVEGLNLKLTATNQKRVTYSRETRQKMSQAHKGKVPWNLGIPHTLETKQKMSEQRSGKTMPEEVKQKISQTNTGREHSEETKQKLKEKRALKGDFAPMKGKNHSEETRQKMSEAHSGKVLSEDTRRILSDINKGKKLSNKTKQKISESKKGKPGVVHSEETKKKLSEAHKGRIRGTLSEDTKQKIAKKLQKQVQDLRTGVIYNSRRECRYVLNISDYRYYKLIEQGVLIYKTA